METIRDIEAKIEINELELVETLTLTGEVKLINMISLAQVIMHNVICNSQVGDEEANFYAGEFIRMIGSSLEMREEK